jgi:TonB family protein
MKKQLLIIAILLSPVLLKAQTPADPAKPASEKSSSPVTPASFPDGIPGWTNFLRQNVRYPKAARDSNITGKVVIKFVIEEDGSLSDFTVLRSPSEMLTKESLRVLALSPKWTPGTQDGKPVKVYFTCPINFSLSPPAAQKPVGQ